jgi:Ni/Co efflux regulator RcnB
MRSMRLAALAVAMTLAFSGLALARDHDDDHNRDKHADRHHDSNHDRDHQWNRDRDHDRDHDRWQRENRGRWRGDGDHDRDDGYYRGGQVYNRYPRGYPGGDGYPSGGYPSGGYGYPGSVYGRGGYGNGGSSGAGYNQGFQDGSYQARKDGAERKPFNPNPRGASHSDHGYHSSMGDKYSYQASYDQGYHSGYQSNYGGRGGRGWGF